MLSSSFCLLLGKLILWQPASNLNPGLTAYTGTSPKTWGIYRSAHRLYKEVFIDKLIYTRCQTNWQGLLAMAARGPCCGIVCIVNCVITDILSLKGDRGHLQALLHIRGRIVFQYLASCRKHLCDQVDTLDIQTCFLYQ